MRPFAKDSQPTVVIKGRRKSKLAAPKSKSAAALVKRKSRNGRRKQSDATDELAKEPPCQFVPVRRKPLGEYMKFEVQLPAHTPTPSLSPSSSSSSPSSYVKGMRMSYAAAVQTGPGVKVMISPRLKKITKSSKCKSNKITTDAKFRIFDEQPKPHIVRIDPKVFWTDAEQKAKATKFKSTKSKKSTSQEANIRTITTPNTSMTKTVHSKLAKPKTDPHDLKNLDIRALKFISKRQAATNTGQKTPAATNLNLGSSSSATTKGHHLQCQGSMNNHIEKPPVFLDSVSYLSFHQQRLQRIISNQTICAICLQSPELEQVPQFEDMHFKYLEEAALLAQNRTMLRLWMNSDQLIC